MMTRRNLLVQGGVAAGLTSASFPGMAHAASGFDAGAIESILRAEMAEALAPGAVLAVVRAGEVLHLQGYGTARRADGAQAPVTADTLFRIGSVSKMFVSATALSLAQGGALDLDAPVEALIPDLAGPRLRATATVRRLLNHNAGMMELLTDNGPADDGQLARQILAYDDSFQMFPAGAVFSYSAPGYNLAGLAIERAAGVPFADAVQSHVTDPLGMVRSGFRPEKVRRGDYTEGHGLNAAGALMPLPYINNPGDWPDGFMATSGAEMARYLRTVLGGGMLDGQRVLAPEVLGALLPPQVALPPHSRFEPHFARGPSYGFGWVHDSYRGIRVLQHGGWITGFGASVVLVPDHDLAVFAATSQDNVHLPETVQAVLDALLPVSEAKEEPLSLSKLPADLRTELADQYLNPGWASFTLADTDGTLFRIDLDQNGAELSRRPLLMAGPDWLVATGPDGAPGSELIVLRDTGGGVLGLFDIFFALARVP